MISKDNDRLSAEYAIYPLDPAHLKGIVSAVFLHSNTEHLMSNFLPLAVSLIGLQYFYAQMSIKVCLSAHLMTGALTWIIARPAYHIGASGLIYALIFFAIISALIRRNRQLVVFAFIVLVFQSGLVWGLFPQENKISWEGHLSGAMSGIVLAYFFRKEGPRTDMQFPGDQSGNDSEDEYFDLLNKD